MTKTIPLVVNPDAHHASTMAQFQALTIYMAELTNVINSRPSSKGNSPTRQTRRRPEIEKTSLICLRLKIQSKRACRD